MFWSFGAGGPYFNGGNVMLKRISSVLMTVLFLFVFVSCGSSEVKDIDTDQTVNSILEKYDMTAGAVYTSSSTVLGEYLDEDLIISCYGDATDWPDFKNVEKYCVYMDDSNPKVITDVGIFKLKNADYCDTLMKYINVRIDTKIAAGAAYPDIDVETLEKAVVEKYGNYVYYAVSPEVDNIISDIEDSLGK